MITLEKVKFIREKKSDNPDQLNLFGDNGDKKNKKNKAQQYTDKINKQNKNRPESKRGKRVFPGDKSGAYQTAKSDLEARQGIKKAGGSGDIGYTAPDRASKVAKRITRADKLRTPDPFTTPKPKKPIRPFGDKPVTTGIDKPVTPKKTFKSFRQDTKRKTIQDIRSSDRRLYDTGKFPDKKPSLVQQRKDAKARVKAFNAQQARKFRAYADLSPDGDTGAQFKEVKPKNVKFSSGAKGKFVSGSPEMGGESKKFAGRNRTPAPQVTKPVLSKTPPKVDPKFAKDAINPQVVTKTPFDAKSTTRPKVTSNVTYTDKPISKKVTNSKGIGNRFRGPENLAAKNAEIKKLKDAIKKNQSQATVSPKVTSSADRGIGKALKSKGFYQYKIPFGDVDKKPPKTTKLGKFQKAIKKSKLGRFGLKALKNPYALAGAAVVGTGLGAYALLKNRGKNANAAKPLKSDDLATSGVAIRSTKTNKPIEMPLGKKFYTSRKDGVEPIGKNTYVPNEKKYQAQLRNNKK